MAAITPSALPPFQALAQRDLPKELESKETAIRFRERAVIATAVALVAIAAAVFVLAATFTAIPMTFLVGLIVLPTTVGGQALTERIHKPVPGYEAEVAELTRVVEQLNKLNDDGSISTKLNRMGSPLALHNTNDSKNLLAFYYLYRDAYRDALKKRAALAEAADTALSCNSEEVLVKELHTELKFTREEAAAELKRLRQKAVAARTEQACYRFLLQDPSVTGIVSNLSDGTELELKKEIGVTKKGTIPHDAEFALRERRILKRIRIKHFDRVAISPETASVYSLTFSELIGEGGQGLTYSNTHLEKKGISIKVLANLFFEPEKLAENPTTSS